MTAPVPRDVPGPPTPRRAALVRPRLARALTGRFDRRVTTVVAGGGFGKTTVLAQALAENRLDPCGIDVWVPCRPEHASAHAFAAAVATALGVGLPAADPEVATLATDIADAVLALAPVDVVLVVDDLHRIPDDAPGMDVLRTVLDRLPANGHLVVASRTPPPLPLARLAAHGEVLVVDEAALAFTPDETAAFAALRGVDPAALVHVGGWPALAELAADTGHHHARDFLLEEVLAALDADRRDSLAALALVGPADDALLTAALGRPVSVAATVEGIPLCTVDPRGRVSVHDLWREIPIAADLDARSADVLRAAGAHHRSVGDLGRAFDAFADADAWPDALDVLVDGASIGSAAVGVEVLEGWLARTPSALDGDPAVLLARGVVTRERGADSQGAVRLLDAAIDGFRARGDVATALACSPHLAEVALMTADEALLVKVLGFALEHEDHPVGAMLATFARALLADIADDPAGAIAALERLGPATLPRPWRAARSYLMAEQLLSLGEAEASAAAAADALDDADGTARLMVVAVQVQALWAAGRIEAARAVADAAPTDDLRGSIGHQIGAHQLTARYHALLGDVDGARAAIAAAHRLGAPPSVQLAARDALCRAAVAVATGDDAGAADALRAALPAGGFDGPVARAWRRSLALPYVLLPETRAHFDDRPLGPAFAVARDLARTITVIRNGDPRAVSGLAWPAPGLVQASLPVPWAVELAIAGETARRPEAPTLVDHLGAPARPFLEAATAGAPARASAARRLLAQLPVVPEASLHVTLLGPFAVRRGDAADAGGRWRRGRVRQLLAYLVLHGKATRDELMDALWPDLDRDAAANNLKVTLSYLLRALAGDGAPATPSYFVRTEDEHLVLVGTDRLDADVWHFEREAVEAASADRDGVLSVARDRGLDAVARWHEPYLATVDARWAEDEVLRLRTVFAATALRSGELALAAGDAATAETMARRVLRHDEWSERAYRLLAGVQLARGDRDGARVTMRRAADALADLGVDPEPATRMLARRLAGDVMA